MLFCFVFIFFARFVSFIGWRWFHKVNIFGFQIGSRSIVDRLCIILIDFRWASDACVAGDGRRGPFSHIKFIDIFSSPQFNFAIFQRWNILTFSNGLHSSSSPTHYSHQMIIISQFYYWLDHQRCKACARAPISTTAARAVRTLENVHWTKSKTLYITWNSLNQ